jgi:hypothetical protein
LPRDVECIGIETGGVIRENQVEVGNVDVRFVPIN